MIAPNTIVTGYPTLDYVMDGGGTDHAGVKPRSLTPSYMYKCITWASEYPERWDGVGTVAVPEPMPMAMLMAYGVNRGSIRPVVVDLQEREAGKWFNDSQRSAGYPRCDRAMRRRLGVQTLVVVCGLGDGAQMLYPEPHWFVTNGNSPTAARIWREIMGVWYLVRPELLAYVTENHMIGLLRNQILRDAFIDLGALSYPNVWPITNYPRPAGSKTSPLLQEALATAVGKWNEYRDWKLSLELAAKI